MPYTETAGELALEVEQEVLRKVLRKHGVRVERLKRCEVYIRSHGRRRLAFSEEDFCSIPQKLLDGPLVDEFNHWRGMLPGVREDDIP